MNTPMPVDFAIHPNPTRRRRGAGVCLGAVFFICLTVARGQGVARLGGEMNLLGPLPGDQVMPALALSGGGGVLTWEDNNLVPAKGVHIGGALLDSSLSAQSVFCANKVVLGEQTKPQVQILRDGSILHVWESSAAGKPYIYARFAKGMKFYTSDIRVNTDLTDQKADPAVAALPDGGAIVVWSGYKQGGSLWGVFARKLTATGAGATPKEFQVNQFKGNERSAAVTALANGNYVVAWASEQERSAKSADIYARIFKSSGVPVTDEFLVNSSMSVCANPALAPLGDGGFVAAWSQKDAVVYGNGWDVWGRAFDASGKASGKDFTINSHLEGDQYRPKLAAGPNGVLAVWTSMGQDGDHEGVYGRYLPGGRQVSGPEFQVNTTWKNRQIHPAVAWNGVDRFLVVWTSFSGTAGFDLYGQMYTLTPNP
jgi:hypothetical protein